MSAAAVALGPAGALGAFDLGLLEPWGRWSQDQILFPGSNPRLNVQQGLDTQGLHSPPLGSVPGNEAQVRAIGIPVGPLLKYPDGELIVSLLGCPLCHNLLPFWRTLPSNIYAQLLFTAA